MATVEPLTEEEGCVMCSDSPEYSDVSSDEVSFFSFRALRIFVVPFFCGMYYGYNFLFVPLYYQMRVMAMDCASYTGGREACESLPYADCKWFTNSTHGGYCGWTEVTCRVLYPNSHTFGGDEDSAKEGCLADNRCTWKYSDKKCENPVGYDSAQHAIFAGALTAGCMVGSVIGGRVATSLGSKLTLLVCGIVALACSVMYHVSIATDDFWVLIPARFVMGMSVGVTAVTSPLYVDQNAPPELKRPLGSTFMVCVCFGSFIAGLTGMCLGQSITTDSSKDQHLMGRLQGVGAVASALSLAVVLLGVFVRETRVTFAGVYSGHKKGAIEVNPNEYSYLRMVPCILIGAAVASAAQLTGFRGLSNYAPTIFGNLGVAPFVGTFLLMSVSLVGSLCSLRLSFYFSSRHLFLASTFLCSAMCLFFCGIPVYPGVSSENVRNVVAVIGSLVYIWSYQCGLGPFFFVLAQEIFPLSFRPKGASIVHTLVFTLNLGVTVAYPIATEHLSGGASGDQNKGQSIVFIFFGVAGFICFLVEFFFLYPWDKELSAPAVQPMLEEERAGEGEEEGEEGKNDEDDLAVGGTQEEHSPM